MIVAGFAGVGKTYFCENTKNAIDFVIMPFKYANFYQVSESLAEGEEIKAHEDLEFVVGWEEYYHFALMDVYRKFPQEIIVIPTVRSVLEMLKKDNIPVTIVYPDVSAKEEYARRYKERGNSEAFFKVFLERWEQWIETLDKFEAEHKIKLQSFEYLSDVIPKIPYEESQLIPDKETYIYDTYFKNGLDKGFIETPIGQLMKGFGVYE